MAHIVNPLPAGPTSETEIAKFETHIGHMSLGASKPATHGRFKTSRGVNVQ